MQTPSREIAYPFRVGPDGGIAYVEDPYRTFFQHIVVVVLTQPGERVMLPEFGTPTAAYLFENVDEATAGEVTLRVQQALARWEPAVVIHDVSPDLGALSEGLLHIVIKFSVPPSQTIATTVVDVGGTLAGEISG